MKSKSQGFTLIELVVTLALAALVLGFAVPSTVHMMRTSTVISMNNDVVADLQYARSEAIKRNVPVTMCASTNGTACAAANSNNWDTGWIVFVESTAFDGTRANAEPIVRTHTGATTDTMTIRTGTGGVLTVAGVVSFQGNGFPVFPASTDVPLGDFIVCEANNPAEYSRRVRLNQSGRISSAGSTTSCTVGAP